VIPMEALLRGPEPSLIISPLLSRYWSKHISCRCYAHKSPCQSPGNVICSIFDVLSCETGQIILSLFYRVFFFLIKWESENIFWRGKYHLRLQLWPFLELALSRCFPSTKSSLKVLSQLNKNPIVMIMKKCIATITNEWHFILTICAFVNTHISLG
jgi:hypothetical protein